MSWGFEPLRPHQSRLPAPAAGERGRIEMQVTETLSQGLKREYAIVVPASDLATRLNAQLADMKDKVRINGFRPGKVPVAHLKRVSGRSVLADVVPETI